MANAQSTTTGSREPEQTRLRLVFMGTPDFSVPCLQALIDAGHDVVAVYSQPPRPAGRGHKERPSPVHRAAETHGIEVRTPKSLKGSKEQDEFRALKADIAIVVAYGLILPQAILDAPRLGCVNVHASLLPRWRGAAPIQRAIVAGDKETGVTIMQMEAGLDTGPMLARATVPITATTTAQELHDRLSELGAELLVKTLPALAAGAITPEPQPDHGVTYAHKLEKHEGRIDWSRPARELDRLIRGFTPWPGAFFMLNGEQVKLLAAELVEDAPGAQPGTVLDDRLTIACGQGALRIRRLQRPGRKPLDADAFLRGVPLKAGTRLCDPAPVDQ